MPPHPWRPYIAPSSLLRGCARFMTAGSSSIRGRRRYVGSAWSRGSWPGPRHSGERILDRFVPPLLLRLQLLLARREVLIERVEVGRLRRQVVDCRLRFSGCGRQCAHQVGLLLWIDQTFHVIDGVLEVVERLIRLCRASCLAGRICGRPQLGYLTLRAHNLRWKLRQGGLGACDYCLCFGGRYLS